MDRIHDKEWNHNKLFTLFVRIEIEIIVLPLIFFFLYISYCCVTLYYNQNGLLQVTKMTLVDYCHYLF